MSPTATMIISGLISAGAAALSLYSGATFKRAFDQYHQQKVVRNAPDVSTGEVRRDKVKKSPLHKDKQTRGVQVGIVQSDNQKGGVTAGYVDTVNQRAPE